MPVKCRHTATYEPLNTLKSIAQDVWIVDGPLIDFGPGPFKIAFPTRMSVIRLSSGGLFVHSPTALSQALRGEIEALGPVAHIVAPNRIHYWWVPDWHAAWPDAPVWLAPRIREQAGGRIDFHASELDRASGYPWDAEIATLPVSGAYMTEVEFFHKASRTLVLTDFIENFEPGKLGWFARRLTWMGGVLDPHGSMPRDMRLTFRGQRPQLKAAVEQMIAWDPERVIIAHGRWYQRNGAAELKRAFGWLL